MVSFLKWHKKTKAAYIYFFGTGIINPLDVTRSLVYSVSVIKQGQECGTTLCQGELVYLSFKNCLQKSAFYFTSSTRNKGKRPNAVSWSHCVLIQPTFQCEHTSPHHITMSHYTHVSWSVPLSFSVHRIQTEVSRKTFSAGKEGPEHHWYPSTKHQWDGFPARSPKDTERLYSLQQQPVHLAAVCWVIQKSVAIPPDYSGHIGPLKISMGDTSKLKAKTELTSSWWVKALHIDISFVSCITVSVCTSDNY